MLTAFGSGLVCPDFLTMELAVENGEVLRDTARKITKFAIIDRYSGNGKLASMFWLGCGPADPDTALACSVAHDSHNVWTVGSCDGATVRRCDGATVRWRWP